jgi:pimeloyl-ACP methyl ester carboxylesterase
MWLVLLFATIGLVPLGLLAVLVVWSYPGRPRAAPGGSAEKLTLPINGAAQGLIVKSRDAGRPVLLYLHGGMPDYFLALSHHARVEEDFTVCWWEQRGSGLSYHADDPPPTVDQLVADTIAVTDYLRTRFRKERIYLMGHSGGTYLGILAVARAPERYHAYVAVAQIANQRGSEERAYHYMRERFAERGDARMVARLDAGPVLSDAYYRVRDVAMHRLGVGTTRAMRSVFTGLFLRSLQCRDYTLREKIRLWRGKIATGVSSMWAEMVAHDLTERVPEVQVPVYFLHGAYDYTCSYAEARTYYEVLRAPLKAFYTFPDAAHSPIFEDPARAQGILRTDVLQRAASLADDWSHGSWSGMFADVPRDK